MTLADGAIRHTVSFRLRHPDGSDDERRFLEAAAATLPADPRSPRVDAFEVLDEVSPKNGFRFGFSMEFADQAAYDAYNAHPEHTRFVASAGTPRSRTSSRSTTERARAERPQPRLRFGA